MFLTPKVFIVETDGDGYCRKLFEMNTYRVFCIWNYTAKSIFYNCGDSDRHVGIYASPDNWRTSL